MTDQTPGWASLITAARRLSVIHGALTLPRHDVSGGLLFDINATGADENDQERIRGILAAIHAASTETCAACGGPGDHVTLQSGQRSTRCADCREPGDVVRPRPPWRRERDPQDGRARRAPLVEDLVGLKDLEILMEARHEPGEHRTWPVTTVDHGGNLLSGVEAAGWNHLVRAALRLLLPMECPGSNPVWRLGQLKEKVGKLIIYHVQYTRFLEGVTGRLPRAECHRLLALRSAGAPDDDRQTNPARLQPVRPMEIRLTADPVTDLALRGASRADQTRRGLPHRPNGPDEPGPADRPTPDSYRNIRRSCSTSCRPSRPATTN